MLFRIFHKQTGAKSQLETRYMLDLIPGPYKEYPRFPHISLPAPLPITESLGTILERRESANSFGMSPLTLEDISHIIYAGAGLNHARKKTESMPARHHPSGGRLYPLEYYLAPFRVEGLGTHLYHYSPDTHQLETLTAMQPPEKILEATAGFDEANFDPAAILIMTSVWGRTYPRYADFAYRLALAECGHSAQNMLLAATARNVKARPIMGFDHDIVARALDITDEDEDPLYIVLLGK
jgi:SagB-type dehydrogenase family enzyme